MAGFARWCFIHRKAVLAVWLIALIGFFAVGRLTGSAYQNSSSLPGTDSAKALQVLTTDFPARAGDSDQIVVRARQGTLRSPAAETAVTSMLARIAKLPHVRSVASPYGPGGQISRDGTIGIATVNLDAQADNVPDAAIFVDAYIIRTVLVPAAMHVMGRANWWLPAWLDRVLPRFHAEPSGLPAAGSLPRPVGVGSRRP